MSSPGWLPMHSGGPHPRHRHSRSVRGPRSSASDGNCGAGRRRASSPSDEPTGPNWQRGAVPAAALILEGLPMSTVRVGVAVATLATVTFAFSAFTATPAFAHEVRKVGAYEFTVGWEHEPTYTGVENAVQLILKD